MQPRLAVSLLVFLVAREGRADPAGELLEGNLRVAVTCPAPGGRHRVRVEAPDCLADEREVDVPVSYAVRIEGRLAIASPEQVGTVGAPDGIGLGLGAFLSEARGVWLSTSLESRWLVGAIDHGVGFGPTFLEYSLGLRVGWRLASRTIALAAGPGLGASFRMPTGAAVESGEEPTVAWQVPLWVSLAVKPWCDWGLQALVSHPVDDDALVAMAGLFWQPSQACSEHPGVRVWP